MFGIITEIILLYADKKKLIVTDFVAILALRLFHKDLEKRKNQVFEITAIINQLFAYSNHLMIQV